MAAGFRTRRIKCEQSIGDKLKRARIRHKITVAAVEEATRIRGKFILALESDSWDQIPSEVYGRGYLETYVQFLQLPVEAIMKQYTRERELYARNCLDAKVELAPQNQVRLPRFLLTPRFFTLFFAMAFLVFSGTAVISQVRHFVSSPYLKVETKGAVTTTDGSPAVDLSVCTAVGAQVQVNGQSLPVDPSGCSVQPMKKGSVVEVKASFGSGKKSTTELVSL